MYILVDFNLAVCFQNHQFAKFNSPPIFLAIRYSIKGLVVIELVFDVLNGHLSDGVSFNTKQLIVLQQQLMQTHKNLMQTEKKLHLIQQKVRRDCMCILATCTCICRDAS